jgi:hypothetical protein
MNHRTLYRSQTGPKQQICGKVLFLQHRLLLVEQGIKALLGQVMVLPIGNDMRQITACVCSIRFSLLYADIGPVFALHSPLALLRLAEGQSSSFQRARLSSARRELWRFLGKGSSLYPAHPAPNSVETQTFWQRTFITAKLFFRFDVPKALLVLLIHNTPYQ